MEYLVGLLVVGVLFFIYLIGVSVYDGYFKPRRDSSFKIGDFTVRPWVKDKNTGFPALPEDWEWRVTGDEPSEYAKFRLSLVNDEGNVVEEQDWYADIYGTSESKIKQTLSESAVTLLSNYRRHYVNKARGLSAFYGSYPPKNLNEI